MKYLSKQILRLLFLLLAIQAFRSIIHWGLFVALDARTNSTWEQTADIGGYLLTAALLYLIFKPNGGELGLIVTGISNREKNLYFLVGGFLVFAVGSSYFLQKELLLENIKAVFVVPIFEELLFRGWGWKSMEFALSRRHQKVLTWLLISFLFAIWHIGYIDSFYLTILPRNPGSSLSEFLLWKVGFTFIFGLVVGLPRLKTGKVFGSLLFHAILNLFGK